MLDELFLLSQNLIQIYNKPYQRYFLCVNKLQSRFSIIIGQRGVGKTTAIVQYMMNKYQQEILSKKMLYVLADHFAVSSYSLYEIAEEFYKHGGELICIDEVHKYANWAKELKSIFDTFPKLNIIASGSSIIEIKKTSHDLSRRALVYGMKGCSFREFIEMTQGLEMPCYDLSTISNKHQQIATEIVQMLEKNNLKILALFKSYLQYGYYPYHLEFPDQKLFYITLEQSLHTTLESDLVSISPSLSGNSIQKIKKLLSVIVTSVPFPPDLNKLKNLIDVSDERTLKNYLKMLEDAGIILTLSRKNRGLRALEKPDKIYLNNSNQAFALSQFTPPDKGNMRETFFINIVSGLYEVHTPADGDFQVNEFTIEIGGKNKTQHQIKKYKNAILAIDDIEIGIENKIPLWLFGFLY